MILVSWEQILVTYYKPNTGGSGAEWTSQQVSGWGKGSNPAEWNRQQWPGWG